MARKALIAALAIIAVASPLSAAGQEGPGTPAPPGGPNTEYCMRVEPITGSRIETVQCWTREEWAEGGVNVDVDWPKYGVAVVNA
jgi:hypothetical protein